MEKQTELEPTKRAVELKRLSDTRWACQYYSLWAIKQSLPSILATLEEVSNQTNSHRAIEARSLNGLIDAQFVLQIYMLENIFGLTKTLSDQLQATDLDLASAIDLVFSLVDTLKEERNDETWTHLWQGANDTCERVGIDMQRQQAKRKIIQPSHLQQFHVSNSHTRKKILQTPEDYKIHCFSQYLTI